MTQLFPVPAAQVAQLERALHGTLVPDEPSTPPSGSSLLVRIQLSNRVVEVHFPEGQALFDAAAPPADHEAFGSADLREVATRLVSSYRGWERTR